ncbi:polysaccharide deacetylase family protein [Caproicibacter sp.]|uniref:polysaccharide deacetylase family protein n=1 Tax=Caproicibacter sp. TaxID=2814884 RepID=UPI00398A3F2B
MRITVVRIKSHILMISAFAIFFCFAALTLQPPSMATNREPEQLPIILYHMISPQNHQYGITPRELESDLIYLSKNNYSTITMTQLIDFVSAGKSLPPNPIILSFDDGYLDNYVYAFPLLKKYHAKMVFSIIGKSTDDFTEHPSDNLNYAHVTWNQLNEMISSGLVEVQNHTYHLHETSGDRIGCMQKSRESLSDYERVLTGDVCRLQNEVREKTGFTPNTFVYPYGKSSKNTDAILKKIGFQATLSCTYGINVITKDPNALFGLCRIERAHGKSLKNLLNPLKKG